MKKSTILLSVILAFIMVNVQAQEKSRKQIKEEKKLELQKQTEGLMNSKEFMFVGTSAMPTGMKSVNLTTNPNFLKFQPEMIESEMPFFGRAYSAVGYGNDTGVKFKGKPDEFNVSVKGKNYEVSAVVKTTADNFKIYMTVGADGSANLSITSNNRSSISYFGNITAIEKK